MFDRNPLGVPRPGTVRYSSHTRSLTVSDIRFVPARPKLASTGLIGFVTCTINDRLQLGGIAVRRTLDGRVVLSFPERGSHGFRLALVRPLDDDARLELEGQIFEELRRQGRLAS